MAVLGYERTPDGGYLARYDNGLIERFDAAGNSLGYEYAEEVAPEGLPYGLAPLSAPPQAPTPPDWSSTPRANEFTVYDNAPTPTRYGRAGQPNPFLSSSAETGGFGYAPAPAPPYAGAGASLPSVPASFGSSSSGSETPPPYANGQMHPAFGGQPRQPGGSWAQQGGGYDNRQQVRVPGGSSAGPFETSASPLPQANAYGGSADRGGGGGGGTTPMYDKLRAKGMAMGNKLKGYGSSGGSASYGGDTAAYRRQQREYRQQQRAYEDGTYLYDQYKMRGFSKKMNPQQAESLYYRPSSILPKAAPGLDPSGLRYQQIKGLPAAQLSMLAYGRKGKAKEGPSQFVNNLAKFYGDVASRGDLPDYDQMVRALNTARAKSPLGAQFKDQPIGFAADTYESFVNAIVGSSGLDPSVARARAEQASDLIDQYGSRYLRRPVKKAPPINRWVGQRMTW